MNSEDLKDQKIKESIKGLEKYLGLQSNFQSSTSDNLARLSEIRAEAMAILETFPPRDERRDSHDPILMSAQIIVSTTTYSLEFYEQAMLHDKKVVSLDDFRDPPNTPE